MSHSPQERLAGWATLLFIKTPAAPAPTPDIFLDGPLANAVRHANNITLQRTPQVCKQRYHKSFSLFAPPQSAQDKDHIRFSELPMTGLENGDLVVVEKNLSQSKSHL